MSWPSKSATSGFTKLWKFWRHCCCRYGRYPLLVAIVVSAACALDLYSFVSCDFLEINIGFNPSNTAWNQSTASIGLFYYETGEIGEEFGDNLAPGCVSYSDSFEEQFIDGDRTWQASRVMGMISAISGMISTATAWMLVFTPLPACFVWPGIMLPGLMLAFIAEGSKFLFFDVSVCSSSVWYPSGAESSPQPAKSCSMGSTAYYVISACVIFFVALVMTCLKEPVKRMLKEDYGNSEDVDFTGVGALAVHSGSLIDDPENQNPSSNLNIMSPNDPFDEREGGGALYYTGTSPVMSMSDEEVMRDDPPPGSYAEYSGSESFVAKRAEDANLTHIISEDSSADASFDTRDFSDSGPMFSSSLPSSTGTPDKELHALVAKVGDVPDENLNSLVDRVAESDSDELISQCVSELALSFRDENVVAVEEKTKN